MARIIVITSGKGGVGKTTSAINLAAAFNLLGKETIIVDANITTPNVGLHLGAPIIPVDLTHVLSNKAKVQDSIYQHHSGIKVVPSSLSLPKGIKPEKLQDFARKIRRFGEIIVFDSAAGLGREAVNTIEAADDVLIVTQAELPALTDALKTIKVAEKLDKNVKGIVLTRYTGKETIPMESIESMLEVPILERIPEDRAVKESLQMKDAVVHTHPKSRASVSYRSLAAKLLGKRYIEEWEKQNKRSRFYKLLEKLGLT